MADRPPFILCFAADLMGCGLQRVQLPIASLVDAGVADGRIDMQLWSVDAIVAAAPDTIVFQRQVEDGQLGLMRQYREALPDTLFVYELDDYLGEVSRESFHRGFMPPQLAEKVAEGLAICDRVTTSTEPLAAWLRAIGGKDVRVVGNALPVQRFTPRERPENSKLRVGFAGGISHEGDLALLRQAMTDIGEAVQWVFFGTKPRNPPCPIEFKDGVAPIAYLDELAKLNLDLILAPLEYNDFNKCKSNLRILESASAGAAVIAQDIEPYTQGNPPVFSYATTPDSWEESIRRFMAATSAERHKSADMLRQWVVRHHTLEGRVKQRLRAWSKAEIAWRPATVNKSAEPVVVASAIKPVMPFLRHARHEESLEDACRAALSLGADVLWLRPGTVFSSATWDVLRLGSVEDSTIASVMPVANDGPNSFPKLNGWTNMSDAGREALASIMQHQLRGKRLMQPGTAGPVSLLSKQALAMGGIPDVAGCGGNEEIAILEWSMRVSGRGWKHVQVADGYACSVAPPVPPTEKTGLRFQARGYAAHIKTPMEPMAQQDRVIIEARLLRQQWNGLRPGVAGFGHDYQSWKALKTATKTERGLWKHASSVFARYFGDGQPELPPDSWVVFLDQNHALLDGAQDIFINLTAEVPSDVQVIYGDHETRIGDQLFPEFKTALDIEMLMARDYITQVCAIRASNLSKWPENRVDLYEIIFNLALNNGARAFYHTPEVMATLDGSTVPEHVAIETLSRQLVIHARLGDSVRLQAHKGLMGCLVVKRNWQAVSQEAPQVSIIIPTLGRGRLIQPCVNTIIQHTAYPNYEIIVVLNGGQLETAELGEAADDPRVRSVTWSHKDGFNWSSLNNEIAKKHAKGDFLLFMNDDVTVSSLDRDWLDLMMGHAVQPTVGAVGAKLIHPVGVLQHIGVVAHKGIAGHSAKGLPVGHPGANGIGLLTHEASAVTGACMLVERKKFDEVGGFDESFDLNYNDTDFCLRLRQIGYRNVVEIHAELLHPEGVTRDSPMTAKGAEKLIADNIKFMAKWQEPDPYWNVNLALTMMPGGLMIGGLNGDVLHWEDRLPCAGADRVLLINDAFGNVPENKALEIMRCGDVPLLADASGFTLQLTAPMPLNIGAWDIRRPDDVRKILAELGVSRIVLRSLIGTGGPAAPVEFLRFLKRLDMPVEVSPISMAVVTPWVTPEWQDGQDTPFGQVDIGAWQQALRALTLPEMEAAE